MDQMECGCGATSELQSHDFFTFGLTVYMADLMRLDPEPFLKSRCVCVRACVRGRGCAWPRVCMLCMAALSA